MVQVAAFRNLNSCEHENNLIDKGDWVKLIFKIDERVRTIKPEQGAKI